jgi:hypothetical protein
MTRFRLVASDLSHPGSRSSLHLERDGVLVPAMHVTITSLTADPPDGVNLLPGDAVALRTLEAYPEPRHGRVDLEARFTIDGDAATAVGCVARSAGATALRLGPADDATTAAWCDRQGWQRVTGPAPVGAVVRMDRARWGVVLGRRASGLEVLVQAGGAPTLDEGRDETTITIGVPEERIRRAWQPFAT